MVGSIESKCMIGHYIPFAIENDMSINRNTSIAWQQMGVR